MSQTPTQQVHATCVELAAIGVLLLGGTGGGKSDLALRLIDAGARLVADDYTDLALEEGRLVACARPSIAGKLEVRGVGIVEVPSVPRAVVGLAVDLVAPVEVERLPDRRRRAYLGIEIPLLALAPFEASAPAKLRIAVHTLARGKLFAA